MSMLSRAAQLQTSVEELGVLQGLRDQAQALRSRANQFAETHSRIQAAIGYCRILEDNGIAKTFNAGTANALAAYALDLKTRVESDPAVILSPDLDIGPKFIQPLKLLTDRLLKDAENQWSEWLEAQMPQIGSALLEILGRISDFKNAIAVVRAKQQQLGTIARTLPANPQDIATARAHAEELTVAWRELNAENLPQEILEFLRDAGTHQGASLSKLTPAVRAYLEQHQLENSFTVRTR